jgi:hypothetical protein
MHEGLGDQYNHAKSALSNFATSPETSWCGFDDVVISTYIGQDLEPLLGHLALGQRQLE